MGEPAGSHGSQSWEQSQVYGEGTMGWVGRGAGAQDGDPAMWVGRAAQLWVWGTPSPHSLLASWKKRLSSTRPFWESHELCTEATGLGRPIINEL